MKGVSMKFVLSFTLMLVFIAAAVAQNTSDLSGYVRNGDNSPARGVIVSIGNFSVVTDANGYYKVAYLRPGMKLVSVTPPQKVTRTFRVMVSNNPTQRDFRIDW